MNIVHNHNTRLFEHPNYLNIGKTPKIVSHRTLYGNFTEPSLQMNLATDHSITVELPDCAPLREEMGTQMKISKTPVETLRCEPLQTLMLRKSTHVIPGK